MHAGDSKSRASESRTSFSALHYVIAFSAFGLFVLTIMSSRTERRQAQIEQRFHGIQEMQRQAGAEGRAGPRRPLKGPEDRPRLITIRPIMILLGIVMVVAWLMLLRRRFVATRIPGRKTEH